MLERVHAAQFDRKAPEAGGPTDDRPQVVVILPDNGRGPRPVGGNFPALPPAIGAGAHDRPAAGAGPPCGDGRR